LIIRQEKWRDEPLSTPILGAIPNKLKVGKALRQANREATILDKVSRDFPPG
jgi:hypothetical protein